MQYAFTQHADISFSDSSPGQFSGKAALYGDVDGGLHLPVGCFDRCLAEIRSSGKMPKLLWQHNPDEPLGPITSLYLIKEGLGVKGELLYEDVDRARSTRALARTNSIGGFSIGFDLYEPPKYANERLVLSSVDIKEVSFATFPRIEGAVIDSAFSVSSYREDEIRRVVLRMLLT